MIKREWLLGVGLLSGSMLSAGALGLAGSTLAGSTAAQADDAKIGAVGAVNTAATAQLQGGNSQTLFVGADVFQNQTVRTDANGLAEIMFTDQSTITVGHGSEVVLDNFVYDPNNQVGQLAVSLSQGAMRFIGGKISKTTPVKISAPTATLTIRGGIGMMNFPRGGQGLAAFLYGIEMTVTGRDGILRSISQPGFGVTVNSDGTTSEPFRLSDEQLALLRQLLESNSPDQGQAPVDPLKPIKSFGSNDTFKPDNPLLNTGVGNNSILNGVVVDTTPIS
jgi:hypothetical protein